jgi:hypothetical protein
LRFLRCQHHLNAAVINPLKGEIDQMADRRRWKLASKHRIEEISPAHRPTGFGQSKGIVPVDNALARELWSYGCHADHPANTTLPNGRSSIGWRKGFARLAEGIDPLDDRFD